MPPYWPHKYDMTVLVGALAIKIGDTKSSIEVLHTVPGLDHADPDTVATSAQIEKTENKFQVLTPVSLLLVKLHALRHFDQEDRNDLPHLQMCIQTSARFIAEILTDTKVALWNCNRILHASKLKPYVKLSQEHGFNLLNAIPMDALEVASKETGNPDAGRI
ncbi:MAG: hypothetical protein ACPGVU_26060, partial [Limisphaerales bacterium]